MKVELERRTDSVGTRTITLVAADATSNPSTIRKWIRMLQLAERWLREDMAKSK